MLQKNRKTKLRNYLKNKEENMTAKTIKEKIKKVNEILLKGENKNVSQDSYSGYTGYKPQYIVDAMNAVFDIGEWGFVEAETQIIEEKEKPSLALSRVTVRIKGVEFVPQAWGQSRITRGDIGDAKKGAMTDAIKKALSYYSIGNRAYHGLLKGDK